MRLLPLLIAVILAAFILNEFHATAAPPPTEVSRFQLVGFTSTPHEGDIGALFYTRECQAEFPDSRQCRSSEVAETVTLPDGRVLISHTTWALVNDEIPCKERGEIEVKGLHYPVRVYEVVEESSPGAGDL